MPTLKPSNFSPEHQNQVSFDHRHNDQFNQFPTKNKLSAACTDQQSQLRSPHTTTKSISIYTLKSSRFRSPTQKKHVKFNPGTEVKLIPISTLTSGQFRFPHSKSMGHARKRSPASPYLYPGTQQGPDAGIAAHPVRYVNSPKHTQAQKDGEILCVLVAHLVSMSHASVGNPLGYPRMVPTPQHPPKVTHRHLTKEKGGDKTSAGSLLPKLSGLYFTRNKAQKQSQISKNMRKNYTPNVSSPNVFPMQHEVFPK